MHYTLQVFTGNAHAQPPAPRDTVEAIRRAAEQLPVRDVIMGWNTDAGLYDAVLPALARMGLRAWLWLPVFSEVAAEEEPLPAISYRGMPQQGVLAIPGEDFRFICPSSEANQDIVLRTYRRDFAAWPWHGVFLDKVRHASFAGGFADGFGCFCDACRRQYGRMGVGAEAIAQKIDAQPLAMLPDGREGAAYTFVDGDVARFYAAKMAVITGALRRIVAAFRAEGLAVGLDVFSPSLAPMVGQDLEALAQMADFLKPMLYCITHAPAGIPYEVAAYRRSFADEARVDASIALQKIWRGAWDGRLMDYGRELSLPWHAKMHPGFEMNVIPGICQSSPAYVTGTARALGLAGVRQAVLSWNLLQNTGDTIRALAAVAGGV